MNELVTLPKTARIVLEWDVVIIKDHKVTNPEGLMPWILAAIKNDDWNSMLMQMISQGFIFDAVMEQGIKEMQDPVKFSHVLHYFYNALSERHEKFAVSEKGVQISDTITKKFHIWKTWDQFYNEIKLDSDFSVKTTLEIKSGMNNE